LPLQRNEVANQKVNPPPSPFTNPIVNLVKLRKTEMVITLEAGSSPEALRKALEAIKKQGRKRADLKPFVGILPVKESPLDFQKRIRKEW
jgi:hypothetical protein